MDATRPADSSTNSATESPANANFEPPVEPQSSEVEVSVLNSTDGNTGSIAESVRGSVNDSAQPGWRTLPRPSINHLRNGTQLEEAKIDEAAPEEAAGQGDSWQDAPTLMADQAREVAAQFEKHRQQQEQSRLTSETSLRPRHLINEIEDFKQYYRTDWTPDRGSDTNRIKRKKEALPSLVSTGTAAGKSRVRYTSTRVLAWHMWHRDLFLTTIHQNVWRLLGFFAMMYLLSFFVFSLLWYIIWKADDECLYGIRGFPMVFNFSVVTQQTIGYGNSGPNNCAWASVVLVVQTIFGLLLDAITIGVLFARISHPQQRARSIFMSETAVIARRDGILKLMFRIADIKTTQVVEPKVRAYLYTWGDGRHTAEGEFIPCRNEELDLGNIDGLLLLPITIEHTIDERSPLCGHTYDSLQSLNAEIVVTFEGTTETGNPFMSRQSYLANEIWWGYQFVRCIHRPKGGETHYTVDTAKFHLVEPQADLPVTLPQSQLSQLVVSRSKRTVPYPILGENTLVLSDSMVLTEDAGELALMFRVGDTYPNQILDPIVRVYIYRWPDDPSASERDYTITELDVGYDTGADRLLLWLPVVVKHTITTLSPLASWRNMSGFLADADSCIAVVVEGYMYCNSQNRMRMRIYNCFNDIKLHHHFSHVVTRPLENADRKPRIDWSRFHSTNPDIAASDSQKDDHEVGRIGGRSTSKGRAARRQAKADPANGSVLDDDTPVDEDDVHIRDAPSSPSASELTVNTFEGSNLTTTLPHLDKQSTFNRRHCESLHRRRLPREAYYEGSTGDFRRSQTLPSRRQSDTQRSPLPSSWRQRAADSGDTPDKPEDVPSTVPEDSNV